MRELEAENPEDFQAYTRMEPAMFRELLDSGVDRRAWGGVDDQNSVSAPLPHR